MQIQPVNDAHRKSVNAYIKYGGAGENSDFPLRPSPPAPLCKTAGPQVPIRPDGPKPGVGV